MTDLSCDVLVRARINADGLTLSVAPGVELAVRDVDIVTEMPEIEGPVYSMILFFNSEVEREEIAETIMEWPDVQCREL
jgi:hypothetical protein